MQNTCEVGCGVRVCLKLSIPHLYCNYILGFSICKKWNLFKKVGNHCTTGTPETNHICTSIANSDPYLHVSNKM